MFEVYPASLRKEKLSMVPMLCAVVNIAVWQRTNNTHPYRICYIYILYIFPYWSTREKKANEKKVTEVIFASEKKSVARLISGCRMFIYLFVFQCFLSTSVIVFPSKFLLHRPLNWKWLRVLAILSRGHDSVLTRIIISQFFFSRGMVTTHAQIKSSVYCKSHLL